MKTKLFVLSFLLPILLIFTVGLYLLNMSQKLLSSSNAEVKYFKEIASAATEVSSYAKRAEGHLFLYLMLRRDIDKEKYPKRLESINEQIAILKSKLKDREGQQILHSIIERYETLKPAGEALKAIIEQDIGDPKLSELKRHESTLTYFHDQTSAIRKLGVDLTNHVIILENRYMMTLQKSFRALKVALFILAGFLLFFVISSGVALTHIIKKLHNEVNTRKLSEQALTLERNKLQKAISEMKTMSSLLPICASCKKIRDDKGYWNQIEAYFNRHTGTQFSHSICPDCASKLYPDYAD